MAQMQKAMDKASELPNDEEHKLMKTKVVLATGFLVRWAIQYGEERLGGPSSHEHNVDVGFPGVPWGTPGGGGGGGSGPIVLPPGTSYPASLLADVQAERNKYERPTGPQLGAILNAVAWKNRDKGWGLSAKPGGHHVMSPQGVWVASDILHHKPTGLLYDVIGDAGVTSKPQWGIAGQYKPGSDRPWVAPIAPK